MDFSQQVVATPPVQIKVAKNQTVDVSSAGCGKCGAKTAKQTTGKVSPPSKQKKTPRSGSSGNKEISSRPKGKSTPKELDSKKSVDARLTLMERDQTQILKHLRKLVPKESLLESGPSLPEMPLLNDNPSSFSAESLTVQTIRLTRKQEKLYNKICHTRKYQQALKDHLGRGFGLRLKTLEYVTSSTTLLKENPLQDFLSTL